MNNYKGIQDSLPNDNDTQWGIKVFGEPKRQGNVANFTSVVIATGLAAMILLVPPFNFMLVFMIISGIFCNISRHLFGKHRDQKEIRKRILSRVKPKNP